MKQFAAYTAAALLAAPVCMVAQAADVDAFVDQSIELVNKLASGLERITPENVEQVSEEILALKPQADRIQQLADSLSAEDGKALLSNPETMARLVDATVRLFTAVGKLQDIMEDEDTSPLQQAAIRKMGEVLDCVMFDWDECDDDEDDEDDEDEEEDDDDGEDEDDDNDNDDDEEDDEDGDDD